MILDTEFFISIDDDVESAEDVAAELEVEGLPTRVPTAVVQELYVSVGVSNDPTGNARAYEALVENKLVVSLDEHIARRAGTLEGQHLASDTKPNLGSTDSIVAATGLTMNEAAVTNDRDFESVDGLDVELY